MLLRTEAVCAPRGLNRKTKEHTEVTEGDLSTGEVLHRFNTDEILGIKI